MDLNSIDIHFWTWISKNRAVGVKLAFFTLSVRRIHNAKCENVGSVEMFHSHIDSLNYFTFTNGNVADVVISIVKTLINLKREGIYIEW